MKSFWMVIELRSDLCVATGDGTAGIIDIEVAHEYGLPIIPAKRIKGCLHEVARELTVSGIADTAVEAELFGISGQEKGGALQVSDAHLCQVPVDPKWPAQEDAFIAIDDYEELVRAVRSEQSLKADELLDELTLVRTRTAIDHESGSAAKTSLHSLRVLKKGTLLRCRIDLEEEHTAALEELLENSVKGLRNMGLGRNRGLGEVRCRLEKAGENLSHHHTSPNVSLEALSDDQGEMEIAYELTLDTPVMIPQAEGLYHTCESWIPGSAVQGALAGMYIQDQGLGETAHEDEGFSRIFLRGGVKFGYAFPTVNEKSFYPCPASWQRVKNEDKYYDLAYSRPERQQLRHEKLLVHRNGQVVSVYAPGKQVRLHHARPEEDRGVGRAIGEKQDKDIQATGQFFQYVSLCAGQTFTGTWQGREKDLKILLESLHKRGNKIRLGRSRTAEYGQATFRWELKQTGESTKECQGVKEDGSLLSPGIYTLWLLTPLILCDAWGRNTQNPQGLIEEMNRVLNCGAELKKSFLNYTQLAGYNSKWRLPKVQKRALAGGSALVIELKESVKLESVQGRRWGLNTGEGCGMVRLLVGGDLGDEGAEKTFTRQKEVQSPPSLAEVGHEQPPLLKVLLANKEARKNRQTEAGKGLKMDTSLQSLNPVRINPAGIHQIIELFEQYKKDQHAYERVKEKLEKIQDQTKKEICLSFFKPCQDKDPAFIEAYLNKAKWKARLKP